MKESTQIQQVIQTIARNVMGLAIHFGSFTSMEDSNLTVPSVNSRMIQKKLEEAH